MYSLSNNPLQSGSNYIKSAVAFVQYFDTFSGYIESQVNHLHDDIRKGQVHFLRKFAQAKLDNTGISSVLAELSELSEDVIFKKSLLTIQQDLNSIILEYSALRRLCFHLAPTRLGIKQLENLDRHTGRLASKLHKVSRNITDQFEIATDRILGMNNKLMSKSHIPGIEEKLQFLKKTSVNNRHAQILSDSIKHRLQEFIDTLYEIPDAENSAVQQKSNDEVSLGVNRNEFEDRFELTSKRINSIEQELIEFKLQNRKSVEQTSDRLEQKITSVLDKFEKERSLNGEILKKVQELELQIEKTHHIKKEVDEIRDSVRDITLKTRSIEDDIAYVNQKTEKAFSRFELDLEKMKSDRIKPDNVQTIREKDFSRIEDELGRVRNRLDKLDEHQLNVAKLLAERLSNRSVETRTNRDDVILDLFKNIDKRLRQLMGKKY